MNEEDEKWIQENADVEDVPDTAVGEFEGTVFMSTDSKHTVSIKANTPEGRKTGMIWMKQVYERLMTVYGSKQENAAKAYKKIDKEEEIGRCPKCNSPMKLSQNNKPYCTALCWTKK